MSNVKGPTVLTQFEKHTLGLLSALVSGQSLLLRVTSAPLLQRELYAEDMAKHSQVVSSLLEQCAATLQASNDTAAAAPVSGDV